MDPDVILAQLRVAVPRLLAAYDRDRVIEPDDAATVAMVAQALDEWMSGGGYLPTEWAAARRPIGVAPEAARVAAPARPAAGAGSAAMGVPS